MAAAHSYYTATFGVLQWTTEEEDAQWMRVMDTLHGNAPLGDPCEDLWHNSIAQLGKPFFYH
jgi:hypothetical protein